MFYLLILSNDSKSYGKLYKIHVNGAHHCSVRYSQLSSLNDELKRMDSKFLAPFPPKKVFSLSARDKEERRLMLEKYLQQSTNYELFIDFLKYTYLPFMG